MKSNKYYFDYRAYNEHIGGCWWMFTDLDHSPAGSQRQLVVMETKAHIVPWKLKFSVEKLFLNLHCVFLTGSRTTSCHLWRGRKHRPHVNRWPHTQASEKALERCIRPCGLHLSGGLWVFEHLDDWLRLWLELLQLGHHSAPLLPQG